MRFFTTLEKAGRLEFFLVRLVLSVASFISVFSVLQLRPVDTTLMDNPTVSDTFSYSAAMIPVFLICMAAIMFFSIINVCRRLKDIGKGFGLALLLFVPIIGAFFELYLLFAKGDQQKTYAPYGDDPYDPQSYIAPAKPNAGPAVSYQGQDLYLPGEVVAAPEQNPGEQAA